MQKIILKSIYWYISSLPSRLWQKLIKPSLAFTARFSLYEFRAYVTIFSPKFLENEFKYIFKQTNTLSIPYTINHIKPTRIRRVLVLPFRYFFFCHMMLYIRFTSFNKTLLKNKPLLYILYWVKILFRMNMLRLHDKYI